MRSFPLAGATLCALALAAIASQRPVLAQEVGPPALFPIPLPTAYPVALTAGDSSANSPWYGAEPTASNLPMLTVHGAETQSPAELPAPMQAPAHSPAQSPMQSPWQSPAQFGDYESAMKGSWDSCTSGVDSPCADASCGARHYIYANGLVMTRITSGGFVTSTDANGDPALAFDAANFGNNWHGGFEIGGGCCFGDCRALEFLYWGLYPASAEQTATGLLDSPIDLADIDYGGGDGNAIFDGAAAHRLRYDYDLHNVELNLIGNYAGPLGCGRLGYCGTGCGERLGFGWLAGFRYINYTEDWLLSAELDDATFDDEADQLNYEVDLQNNLIGFQLGAGLDYCLTPSCQLYVIGKAGIFGNVIEMQQSIYGSAGDATLNTGLAAGEVYDLDADDVDLALCSQIDLGGRYAINQNWSLDMGWRVLALSGVAIAEDNVVQSNLGSAATGEIQTSSSVIIHGGYAGLTYAW
jgi:hypothetical protein